MQAETETDATTAAADLLLVPRHPAHPALTQDLFALASVEALLVVPAESVATAVVKGVAEVADATETDAA